VLQTATAGFIAFAVSLRPSAAMRNAIRRRRTCLPCRRVSPSSAEADVSHGVEVGHFSAGPRVLRVVFDANGPIDYLNRVRFSNGTLAPYGGSPISFPEW
jgi:hypothetical protein